jgi:hypothetical protein
MRRDYFELDVSNVDWVETDEAPSQPLVEIAFTGPTDSLRDRFSGVDGDLLDADEVDVAFRLQESLDEDEEAPGVVAVTNRLTGEFILELNETADHVRTFIAAARSFGEASDVDGCYRVVVSIEDETLVDYEKQTFLVYDTDGEILREESLIPSGIEL